jgi:predicted Ser/Thr protein kinase
VTAGAEEWFDNYERALVAMRQGQYARAVPLLERAIRQRAEPGQNVITYGTNRLARYHPYLTLAEALLKAGQPERAREVLADQRAQLTGLVAESLEKARVASASAPAPTLASPPAATPSPPSAPAMAAPTPTPAPAVAAASPPPAAAPSASARPATGTLDLTSDPAGATVLWEDKLLGRTPLRLELPPGLYPLTLRHAGSADQAFSVRIDAGRRTTEARVLVATGAAPEAPSPAAAGVASVIVWSDPPGAAVYLDDEPLGATDPATGRLVRSGVSPGRHRVRLSYPGRRDVVEAVEVQPGLAATARISLSADRGPARPPLWLLATGVLAVGLAAGFVLRFRRRPGAEAAPAGGELTRTRAAPATALTPSSRPTVSPGPTQVVATPAGVTPGASSALPPTGGHPATRTLLVGAAGAGEMFGEYRLLEPLGKGGMAAVFKAERRGELVALKRPLLALLEDQEFQERFLREAELGRTLHHPNIIRIFERGHVEGVPYFTMELIVGETLQKHLKSRGPLPAREGTRLVMQVAEALDYAHLKGVVHRDLKPSNIMLLEDGTAKVMDYGIARARRFEGLTVTGAFLGTPDYVAPEVAEGRIADARADLYSLGVVFYEVLAGKRPFVADTPFAVLRKHVSEPPPPLSVALPGIAPQLEAIVLRLLSKSPEDRHPGAEELLINLRDFLNLAA